MNKVFILLPLFLISFGVYAQKFKVAGKVLDEAGKPLRGATIKEKGTNNGAIADASGIYSLNVGYTQAILVVSYVGYSEEERDIEARGTQNFTLFKTALLNHATVVGSRNMHRLATDTPAPVDIINVSDITSKQGQMDINQLLQFAIPSFNSNRQSGAEGSDHVDPASLRGLGPDQTLVLVNGKRQHQSALVNIFGSRGRGNTGTDLNAIPAAAVERIEILRDGSAAQYGSDAIAGVINVVLKESVNEWTANANAGMYVANYNLHGKTFDGLNYNANVNYGIALPKKGFINMTADFNSRAHTNRADTNQEEDIVRREYGDPKMMNMAFYYNTAIPITPNFQIYSFGGINRRIGDAYAWTRTANDDRNIPSMYPNGFDPLIGSDILDGSMVIGTKGILWGKWNVDLSESSSLNKFKYSVSNSLNRTLGPPQSKFDAGGFQLLQNSINLNVNRYYKNVFKGLNLAFGGEVRTEIYKIFSGERASYYTYDISHQGGAQGFVGFSPETEVNKKRTNAAAYVDLEADLTKRFLVNIAGRYENYSDFGSTLNGKVGLRFKVTDDYIIRGTVSTGFRAPSMAQKYFNSIFTNIVKGQAVDVVLGNKDSQVTDLLEIPKLKQETSENASFGIAMKPASDFSLTIDGYYIKVKNRVLLTGAFTDADKQIGSILKSVMVSQARFFTNALSSTTTYGVDVVATHTTALGDGKLKTTLSANFNKMELGDVNTSSRLIDKEDIYFGERERRFVLASAPPTKVNLTFDYTVDKLNFMVRGVRFGEIKLANRNYGLLKSSGVAYTEAEYLDVYRPKIQVDLTVGYKFSENLTISLGGSNILNAYPDLHTPALTESGGAWDAVQMGSNGAFLFTRVGFKF